MKRRILYRPGHGFYWRLEWKTGISLWVGDQIKTFGEGIVGRWVGPLPTLDRAYQGAWRP